MSEHVTGFQTIDGIKKYDYNYLANKPESFSNAVKSSAEGSIVRVDDVSPVIHEVKCKVKSKNLFNTADDYAGYTHTYENEILTVSGQYTNKYIILTAGKTYTFSCQSTCTGSDGGGIYIRAYNEDRSIHVNLYNAVTTLSPTVTVTLPEGYPVIRISFYGHYAFDSSGTGTYSEMMLEEGTEATGYVPYVDPTTVTVTRCGKNLLPYPYSTNNFEGTYVSFTVNDNRSVTLKGTPQSDTQFDLATELSLPAGNYCIAGNGTNVRARILSADGSMRYSLNTFTVAEGEKVRIYAVALANEEIDYTFFPMLNLGDEALSYEPYEGVIYTPAEDGAIADMFSLSPTMTLFVNAANTELEIEYEKDINTLDIPTGAGLPEVEAADNGKFLCVVDGAWAAVALTDVSQEGA